MEMAIFVLLCVKSLILRQGKSWCYSLMWLWKGPRISEVDWFLGVTGPRHVKQDSLMLKILSFRGRQIWLLNLLLPPLLSGRPWFTCQIDP